MFRMTFCLSVCLVIFCSRSFGQETLEPKHRNIAYGDHKAQVLDVYLPDSEKPTPVMVFIHGGGWRAGSKNNVPGFLKKAVREGWLAVVSVEYRFTNVAPHPAQTNDCLHAIQFIRSKAKDWNIDPARLGATGGSAGGHLTMYVALHDDIADPKSDNPVEKLSSRVACAVPFAGPSDWTLLSTIDHGHPAYRELIGYKPKTPYDEMDAAKIKSVSPNSFVSKDDPPMMIVHGNADVIVPYEHATKLFENLKATGVEAELITIDKGKHNVSGAGHPEAIEKAVPFIKKHLNP